VTDFAYDDYGRTTQIDSPEGVLNYEFDSRGRKSRTYVGDPLDPTHDWTYTYDTWGRLATVSTVERNDVVLTTPEVTTYSYDLLGNLQRVDQSNGVIAVYEYDTLNRLDILTHYAPDADPEDLSNNDKLYEFDYTVRADGRRTDVTETYWDSGTPKTTTIDWTYDNLV
jgi:YD repeat-containing protein